MISGPISLFQSSTMPVAERFIGLPMSTITNPWWLHLDSIFLESNPGLIDMMEGGGVVHCLSRQMAGAQVSMRMNKGLIKRLIKHFDKVEVLAYLHFH
jgi:hypothetical protein